MAFLSLATFVAFNGPPVRRSSNDAGAAYLNSNAERLAHGGRDGRSGRLAALWPKDPVPAAYRERRSLWAGAGGSAGVKASGGGGSSGGGSRRRPGGRQRLHRPRRSPAPAGRRPG